MTFMLHLFTGITAAEHDASDLLLRLNHGMIGQPLSPLPPTLDHWLHSFSFQLPPRHTKESFAKMTSGFPVPQNRWSEISLFSDPTASISMNVDPKCTSNFSYTPHGYHVTACPLYPYLNRLFYFLHFKNLRHIEYIYIFITR